VLGGRASNNERGLGNCLCLVRPFVSGTLSSDRRRHIRTVFLSNAVVPEDRVALSDFGIWIVRKQQADFVFGFYRSF